jgi:hypothetical protein
MASQITSDEPNVNLSVNPRIKQIELPDKATYENVLNSMVVAFYQKRKGCETERSTEEYCRGILRTCMTQFHPDGRVWKNAPGKNADNWRDALAARLRVYQYDLLKNEFIERKKSVADAIREISSTTTEKKNAIPEDYSRSFTPSEKVMYEEFIKSIESEIPMSLTAVDKMYVKRLAFVHVLNERDIRDVELSKDLSEQIIRLTESLGISGKQRIQKFDKDKMGTLEELTTTYKQTLDEHYEVERDWLVEELELISQAIHRGDLEEFIGMYWVKTLFGNTFNEESPSVKMVDKYIKEYHGRSKANKG